MLSHIKNTHEKEPGPPKKATGGKCKFCNEVYQREQFWVSTVVSKAVKSKNLKSMDIWLVDPPTWLSEMEKYVPPLVCLPLFVGKQIYQIIK